MLQNRVDPWGRIIQTSARGAWMGNRGLLHDDYQQILRPFRLKAWITCVLEFRGRQRQVMAPNRYTELFFLDEATSFSAGHRPCAECRRPDFRRWKTAWLLGNPGYHFHEQTPIREIDTILHKERTDRDNRHAALIPDLPVDLSESLPRDLPDGCFVAYEGNGLLVAGGLLYPWSPFGYGEPIVPPEGKKLEVLTPASIARTFRAGYVPQMALGRSARSQL